MWMSEDRVWRSEDRVWTDMVWSRVERFCKKVVSNCLRTPKPKFFFSLKCCLLTVILKWANNVFIYYF